MGKKRKILLLSTALAAWLACAGAAHAGHHPAPVVNIGVEPVTRNGAITVEPGDTIASVSARYRLSEEGIIALNHLQPPYRLPPGSRLALPLPRTYRVRATDTLYSVSRMYGVPVRVLAEANLLKAPYRLARGQVLHIPQGETKIAQSPPLKADKAAPSGTKTHMAATIIAGPGHDRMLKKPGPSPEHKAFSSMVSKIIAGGASQPSPQAQAHPGLVQYASAPATLPQVVSSSRRQGFVWPVRGQVISGYGPKEGGLYNDGINIAAPRGTPVAAAADGVVAYVGDTLRSYGNLVLIRHNGGMMTAYAHLSAVTVKPGMAVRRGQSIGSVGSTGAVAHAQLHFEVRRGQDKLDPREYLG